MAVPLTSFTLYLDIVNNRLVTSLYDASPFTFPNPYYGEVFPISLYPVVPITTPGTIAAGNNPLFKPFVQSALTLKLNVGIGTGPVAGAYSLVYESITGSTGDQAPWAWTADGQGNGYFVGLLSFYTAALQTAISGLNSLSVVLQFSIADGASAAANPATAYVEEYSGSLNIMQPVIPPTGVASPSGVAATYYTKKEMDQQFVKFNGNPNGATITLPSPTGTHSRVIGVSDAGESNDYII